MNDQFWEPLIFVLTGFGLAGMFFYLKRKRQRLLSGGVAVEGVVFDIASSINNGSSNSTSNYPVIRFVTLEEEWITQTYNTSYPEFILKRGQKVEVFYNPDKPSDFILNMKADKWILLFLLITSIVCLARGTISLINAYNDK